MQKFSILFLEFPRCGCSSSSSWFLPDSKYIIFLLVLIICTMLRSPNARTVSRCFRQLRLLKGCIKSLPFEAARAAVAAFVTSQVDRYNSLLVGAPKYLLDCLQ